MNYLSKPITGLSNKTSQLFLGRVNCNNPAIDTKRIMTNFYQNQVAYIDNLAKQKPLEQSWFNRKQYFQLILAIL
jgi:hypothetical protein